MGEFNLTSFVPANFGLNWCYSPACECLRWLMASLVGNTFSYLLLRTRNPVESSFPYICAPGGHICFVIVLDLCSIRCGTTTFDLRSRAEAVYESVKSYRKQLLKTFAEEEKCAHLNELAFVPRSVCRCWHCHC